MKWKKKSRRKKTDVIFQIFELLQDKLYKCFQKFDSWNILNDQTPRNSDWQQQSINGTLTETNLNPNKTQWLKFQKLLVFQTNIHLISIV